MGARKLLAVRDARVFLAGQAVSSLGDSALWLAVAVWVKGLTGSSGAAGLVFFFFSAPMLFAPISGLVVDRMRRRRLLIATNAFTGCAVLLLLLVDGAGQLWLIYVVMVVYGFSYSVLGAGQSALLTTMLPPELLADANGALRTIQGTLSLVAPLAGAGLFALVGPQPIVILDAVTFAVPVISLLYLRVEEPPPHPRQQHWRAELTAGVRHIGQTQVLRQVTVAAVCAVLGFGFSETTIFSVAGKGLHRAPAFVGVLLSIQGLGAILGGVTAAPLVRRARRVRSHRGRAPPPRRRGAARDPGLAPFGDRGCDRVRAQPSVGHRQPHDAAPARHPARASGEGLRRGRSPDHHTPDDLDRGRARH